MGPIFRGAGIAYEPGLRFQVTAAVPSASSGGWGAAADTFLQNITSPIEIMFSISVYILLVFYNK